MFQERLIQHDYAQFITIPKQRRQIPRNVPAETVMAGLLECIIPDNPIKLRDRCLLELMYATGLRVSEAASISTGDVNLADKTIFITGKGAKDRVVPIGDWVIPWLLEYMENARPKLLKGTTDLLFISKRGNPLFGSNICFINQLFHKVR